jgi:hypothetical protein
MTELRHCCRRASNHATSGRANGRRSHRSNRHLHHRRPRCLAALRRSDGHAGEQATSAFSESTQVLLAEIPALWRVATLAWAPPQCVTSKAGVEPAFPIGCEVSDIFTTSVGRAARDHDPCGKPDYEIDLRGALKWRRHVRTPKSSLCHRCPAHRLVPSGRPRALGRARRPREPRDPGLPFRRMSRASGNKKPSASRGLGRVRDGRTVDLTSGKIAPLSRACAIGRP